MSRTPETPPTDRFTPARAGRMALAYVAVIAAFVLALTLAYALPQEPIVRNLRASLPVLQDEGLFPMPAVKNQMYQLDNYTDAQMLDISMAYTGDNPLERAMAMRSGWIPPVAEDPIAALEVSLAGDKHAAEPYGYYWHGYQVLLRPALLLFTYSDIRYLNLLAMSAALLAFALYLRARAGTALTVAYLAALAYMGFYVVPASMQFSSVTYIMLAATALAVALVERGRFASRDIELFFFVGVVTTFFDLLTAPLLTFGMPLAVAIVLLGRRESARTLRDDVMLTLRTGVAWSVGYALAWTTKAALATVVTGVNILERAGASLALRSGYESRGTMVLSALKRNLLGYFPIIRIDATQTGWGRVAQTLPVLALMALVAGALLWLVWTNRRPAEEVRRAAHVLVLAPLPYVWFVAVSNHSAIHYWYSYRIQSITVFAVLYVLVASLDTERLRARFGRASR